MDKSFKKIIADFEEVKILMGQLQEIRRHERRIKRRLSTKLDKFEFLSEIVGLNQKDKKLTEPLLKYFKNNGLDVRRSPDKDKGGLEDMSIFYRDKLLIIEVTSTEKSLVPESKLTQILKHLNSRQNNLKTLEVSGLTIVNHEDLKPVNERVKKQGYQSRTLKILASNNLTTVTTLTLLVAFIKIKKGEMTVEDLITGLTTPGVYEI